MPIFRIYTDYGFAGTDDTRLVEVDDDITADDIERDERENMENNLTCMVEEVDPDDLEEWEEPESW